MRITGSKTFFLAATAIFAVAIFLSAASSPPRKTVQAPVTSRAFTGAKLSSPFLLTLDPMQSKVHWILPSSLHTVHGMFAVTRGTMDVDPQSGKAGGEIVVNAKSGQSGNDSRDSKMHKEILETTRYPDVVFHPTQVEGDVVPGAVSELKVRGTLSIHGNDHEIVALVRAELNGETWKGTGKFDVPYVAWGMKNPSNFFLKADKVVSVELDLAGRIQPAK